MTLDEMKSNWNKENDGGNYNELTMQKIVKERVRKHTSTAFKYFWASFALQIIVYAMLSHLMVKYWYDPMITLPSLAGIAIYIPFTIIMMRRFKNIGSTAAANSLTYIASRREILERFYQFKKKYELMLIPIITFIGTFLVFELYVPGGMLAYPKGAIITFFVSLASCVIAIQAENKRNFDEPIARLRGIIEELSAE
jgi:hypothetical protein